jgi:hypothetical protein
MDIFEKSNPPKQAASDLSAEQDENRHGEVDEELEAGQPDHRTGGGTEVCSIETHPLLFAH